MTCLSTICTHLFRRQDKGVKPRTGSRHFSVRYVLFCVNHGKCSKKKFDYLFACGQRRGCSDNSEEANVCGSDDGKCLCLQMVSAHSESNTPWGSASWSDHPNT